METLKCDQCERTWEKPRTRGRKPRQCFECTGKNYDGQARFVDADESTVIVDVKPVSVTPEKKNIPMSEPVTEGTVEAIVAEKRTGGVVDDSLLPKGQQVKVLARNAKHPDLPGHVVPSFKGTVVRVDRETGIVDVLETSRGINRPANIENIEII